MKKIGILNSGVSGVISEMGHLDQLVIADAGLPIPLETEKIDLALIKGVPGFIQTLKAVLTELEVEKAVLAQEICTKDIKSKALYEEIKTVMGDIPLERISHEALKKRLPSARAVVRTGECTPYANILLVSGVTF